MGDDKERPPLYKRNDNTLKISGRTPPLKAAQCAFIMITREQKTPEIFYIGGNAGQQAMKAMTILRFKFAKHNRELSLAFLPIRVIVEVEEGENKEKKLKDAVVWRSIIIQQADAEVTKIC